MTGPLDGIPIVGQQHRVVIADHRVITPNVVDVVENGLSMGDSIAHLRIMDPLNQRCLMVPLTEAQLYDIGARINKALIGHIPTDKPEG